MHHCGEDMVKEYPVAAAMGICALTCVLKRIPNKRATSPAHNLPAAIEMLNIVTIHCLNRDEILIPQQRCK